VNLARSLATAVQQKEDEQPYLIPIGERASHVLELFEDRQVSTLEALKELEKAIEEYNTAQREREERGFDLNTFSYYWLLRRNRIAEPENLAPEVEGVFKRFPHFRQNANERRELRAELYRQLLPHVDKASRAGLVDGLMKVRRN
jgi:type I restriction enzyme R subunit